jgi:predicted amidohydrolase YtcJ
VLQYWIKQGVTTAYSFADAREFRVYQELFGQGALPIRIQEMFMDVLLGPGPVIEGLAILGIKPGLENDWLWVGGLKIFVDGALMGLSAATHKPYLNMPVNNYFGLLKFDEPGPLNELVQRAHNEGLQLCIHAIGDKA